MANIFYEQVRDVTEAIEKLKDRADLLAKKNFPGDHKVEARTYARILTLLTADYPEGFDELWAYIRKSLNIQSEPPEPFGGTLQNFPSHQRK